MIFADPQSTQADYAAERPSRRDLQSPAARLLGRIYSPAEKLAVHPPPDQLARHM